MRIRCAASAITMALALTWSGPALAADTAEAPAGPEVASTAPLVAGAGPWLVWERAPELDETTAEYRERRYGAPDATPFPEDVPASWTVERGGYALGVGQGDATRSSRRGPLDGYVPLRLWVARPDGAIEEHVIDRAYTVRDVAMGPAGILLRTRKAAPEGEIMKLAVAGRFEKGRLRNRCCELQADGSWRTDESAGLPRVIRFGQYRDRLQRIGLRRADLSRHRHWVWHEDTGWSETETPTRRKGVVATEDGFFTLGGDGRLHFSADGFDWEVIHEPDGWDEWSSLASAGERLLYVGAGEIAWVGPDGLELTPFGQAFGEAGPLRSPGAVSLRYGVHQLLPWPGSDDGLVLIDAETDSALFTPDGERWGLAPLAVPADYDYGWATRFEVRDGQLVQYHDSDQQDDDEALLAYRAVVTDERPG